MQQPNVEPYIARGALGGALGALLMVGFVGIQWAYSGLTEGLASTLIISFALALIGGPVTGVIIGYVIWMRAAKIGVNPHPVVRVLIGIGVLLALSIFTTVTGLIRGRDVTIVPELLYAVVVGIPTGLLARSKSNPESIAQAKSD